MSKIDFKDTSKRIIYIKVGFIVLLTLLLNVKIGAQTLPDTPISGPSLINTFCDGAQTFSIDMPEYNTYDNFIWWISLEPGASVNVSISGVPIPIDWDAIYHYSVWDGAQTLYNQLEDPVGVYQPIPEGTLYYNGTTIMGLKLPSHQNGVLVTHREIEIEWIHPEGFTGDETEFVQCKFVGANPTPSPDDYHGIGVNLITSNTLSTVNITGDLGPDPFCPGVTGNYVLNTTTLLENSGYSTTWEVPFGAEIVNFGDDFVEVYFEENAIGGDINAQVQFDCGEAFFNVSLPVELHPGLPLTPDIVGPTNLCVGPSNVEFFVPEIPNAVNYDWTITPSPGPFITNGNNSIEVSFPSTGTYTINMTPSSQFCGDGASAVLVVSVNTASEIESVDHITVDDDNIFIDALDNQVGFGEDLLMNPCLLFPSCMAVELEKAYLIVKLSTGEDFEYGDNYFKTEMGLRIRSSSSLSGGGIILYNYDVDMEIKTDKPEQIYKLDITDDFLQNKRYGGSITSLNSFNEIEIDDLTLDISYEVILKKDVRNELEDYNPHISNPQTSFNPLDNKVTFSWKPEDCVSYDNYEFQLLQLFGNNDESEGNLRVDWSNALTIETQSSATIVTVSVVEGSGYYVWRVRPVGNFFEGDYGNDLNWGKWTNSSPYLDDYSYSIPSTVPPSSGYFLNYTQFDENVNWIYSRVFVEGDEDVEKGFKVGEQMSYANGLNNVILNESLSNESGLIVNQSIYDYSGRPSIQTLPIPLRNEEGLGFNPDFLLRNSDAGLYSASDFDECLQFTNNQNEPEIAGTGLLTEYFSSLSTEDNIPYDEGYPFARTVYYNDGRVKEQGSAGEVLRVNAAGGSHTTKTYYSGVAQDELDEIFGKEAPLANSTQKVISVDPNGVMSGTYLGKNGQTLATFLIDNGSNIYPAGADETGVENFTGELGSQVGLDSKDESVSVLEVINNHIPLGVNAVQSTTIITLPVATNVDLFYEITPGTFDVCGWCTTCDYKVRIKVIKLDPEECIDPVTPNIVYDETRDFPLFLLDNCVPVPTQNWDFSPPNDLDLLGPGSYSISMTVMTNNLNVDGIPIEENNVDVLENTIEPFLLNLFYGPNGILNDGVSGVLEIPYGSMDPTSNEINPDFSLDLLYTSWGIIPVYPADPVLTFNLPNGITVSAQYDGDHEFTGYIFNVDGVDGLCGSVVVPYNSCTVEDVVCSTPYFEADFNALYADNPAITFANASDNFDVGTSTFSYGPGEFNQMIANMLSEGIPEYSCTNIIACWESVKNTYGTQLELIGDVEIDYGEDPDNPIPGDWSPPNIQPNIVKDFLNCIGYTYQGFVANSDNLSGSVISGSASPSASTHAYAYFLHDVTAVYIENPPDWDFQLVEYVDPVGDPEYDCYTNCLLEELDDNGMLIECSLPPGESTFDENVQANDFVFSDWSWNDSEDQQSYWVSFIACVNGLENPGPSINLSDTDYLTNFNENVIDECNSHCNSLYNDFEAAIRDEYEAAGYYVAYDFNNYGPYLLMPLFENYSNNTDPDDILEDSDYYDSYIATLGTNDPDLPDYVEFFDEIHANASLDISSWVINTSYTWDALDVDYNMNNLISFSYRVSECEVECLANALVQNCLEACVLPAGTYETYTDADWVTIMDLQEVLTAPLFEIQIPELTGASCPADFESICVEGVAAPLVENTDEPEECEDCDVDIPEVGVIVDAVNDALNDLVTFVETSIIVGQVTPIGGWQSDGANLIWEYNDGAYFGGKDCGDVIIKSVLAYDRRPCEIVSNANVTSGSLENFLDSYFDADCDIDALFGSIFESVSIYNVTIFIGGKKLQVVPGDFIDLNMPSMLDMIDAGPYGFTSTQFSLIEDPNGELDINIPALSEPVPVPYFETFSPNSLGDDGLDDYVNIYTLIYGYDNCDGNCEAYIDLLGPCISNCSFDTEICFNWSQLPPVDDPWIPVLITCEQENTDQLITSVNNQIYDLVNQSTASHLEQYDANCVDPLLINDEFSYGMTLGYHHYTLYQYDRAGNLITTVPPEGVDDQTDATWEHRMETNYKYNSLNQLIRQETPDGGITRFAYNDLGQLRFSQNAKQDLFDEERYSYTKYDKLGRIIEVGQAKGDLFNGEVMNESFELDINNPNFPSSGLQQVTRTVYSNPYPSSLTPQTFLQNRVSYSVYMDEIGDTSDDIFTIYSYDPHGNVDKLYQEIPGLGLKTIEYKYDLVSGNVLSVDFQRGELDQFLHRYSYDTDNRLLLAETSVDDIIWDKDARYDYYRHGPLKRAEIGEDKIQGLDYVYTLQGWLKAVNHPRLSNDLDPGNDGYTNGSGGYSKFASDVFGMQLKYFSGDFENPTSEFQDNNTASLDLSTNNYNLYNGNIGSWTSNTAVPGNYTAAIGDEEILFPNMTGFKFRYDELNRLRLSKFHNWQSGSWTELDEYYSYQQYDANGNIEFLNRNNGQGGLMDAIRYHYSNTNAKTDNLLYHFKDPIDNPSVDDLFLTSDFNEDLLDLNNFRYDEIGNLTHDASEEIEAINWTVSGKIASIIRIDGSNFDDLYFTYDAMGNRVSKRRVKKVYNAPVGEDEWEWTFYVRDASGNVMAIYDRINSPFPGGYNSSLRLSETTIYGSSRLGLLNCEKRLSSENIYGHFRDNISAASVAPSAGIGLMINVFSETSGTSQTTQIDVASDSDDYEFSEIGTSHVDQAGRANEVSIDDLGNIRFRFVSFRSGTKDYGLIYDANNNVMQESDKIEIDSRSEAEIIQVAAKEFYIFTVNNKGKLLLHKVDASLNGGLGGISYSGGNPEINIPIESGINFKSSLASFISDNGKEAYLFTRHESTTTTDKIGIINIDLSRLSINTLEDIHLSFRTTDGFDCPSFSLSPKNDGLALGTNVTSGTQPDSEIRVYTYNTARNLWDYSYNSSIDGVVGNLSFSPSGENIYFIKNNMGQMTTVRSNINKRTNTDIFSSLEIIPEADVQSFSDGRVYVSHFPKNIIKSISSPDDSPVTSDIDIALEFDEKLMSGLPSNDIPVALTGVPPVYVNPDLFTRVLRKKNYEISDHLGNVRSVITDLKLSSLSANNEPENFNPEILVANNYYPFGMLQPGRSYSSNSYRYGFNGMEKDDEVSGNGNSYDFGERIYNPRLGRFFSMDPINPSMRTPYSFAANNPIAFIDIYGESPCWSCWAKKALTVVSIGLDFVPGVGQVKGIAEGLIGYSLDGTKLEPWERALAFVPGGRIAAKVAKVGAAIVTVVKAKKVIDKVKKVAKKVHIRIKPKTQLEINQIAGKKGEAQTLKNLQGELAEGEQILENVTFKLDNGKRARPDFTIVNEQGQVSRIVDAKTGKAGLSKNQLELQKNGGTLVGKKSGRFAGTKVGPKEVEVSRVKVKVRHLRRRSSGRIRF